MNRINQLLNVLVAVLLIVAGGTMLESSGFGLTPKFSEPDDSWFRSAVLQHSQPVVVKFGANWCGPCRRLDPELDRLASSGQVAVLKVDVQQKRDLARHYRVSSIPHVYLFHNGAVVAHRVGYANSDQLRKWVNQNVSRQQAPEKKL